MFILMTSEGHTPDIWQYEQITSSYFVIVMRYIENTTSLGELHSSEDVQNVKLKCTEILNKMNKAGFCHGDF